MLPSQIKLNGRSHPTISFTARGRQSGWFGSFSYRYFNLYFSHEVLRELGAQIDPDRCNHKNSTQRFLCPDGNTTDFGKTSL